MAAGLGTRFGHYTELVPKGFVELGGLPMIERSIRTLLDCGINDILIGTGYKKEAYEALKEAYPMIRTCFSPRYAETNSMYTLWNMRELVDGKDFILLESDLIFDRRTITSLLEDARPNLILTTPETKFQDQYFVECDAEARLTRCSTDKAALLAGENGTDGRRIAGEFVGIHKLSGCFYQEMCADFGRIAEEQPKLGYEYELERMALQGKDLRVLTVEDLHWYEIDDEKDLQYAETHVVPFCPLTF